MLDAGRGDLQDELASAPSDVFWLGLLYPETAVLQAHSEVRAGRLTPCAIGMRVRPRLTHGPWSVSAHASARVWMQSDRQRPGVWIKTSPIDLSGTITLLKIGEKKSICETEFSTAFQDLGADLAARIEVTAEEWRGSPVVSVRLINQSSEKGGDKSVARELYEVSLEVGEIETTYFEIDPLPDSFRYDRRIAAYGENCGVISTQQGTFKSADATRVKRGRPQFWDIEQLGDEPDLTFARLSDDRCNQCMTSSRPSALGLNSTGRRGDCTTTQSSSSGPTRCMRPRGRLQLEHWLKSARLEDGIDSLKNHADLRRTFELMNDAMSRASQNARGEAKYDRWRPFQIGFMLSMLPTLVREEPDDGVVDTVWFATGGGKTETYLGPIITSILLERTRGRKTALVPASGTCLP